MVVEGRNNNNMKFYENPCRSSQPQPNSSTTSLRSKQDQTRRRGRGKHITDRPNSSNGNSDIAPGADERYSVKKAHGDPKPAVLGYQLRVHLHKGRGENTGDKEGDIFEGIGLSGTQSIVEDISRLQLLKLFARVHVVVRQLYGGDFGETVGLF